MEKRGCYIVIKKTIKRAIPDSLFLKMKYFKTFHELLNLKNPKTFNEKLQWLKLYNRNPLYTTLVDKYEVKEYVSKLIGQEYIIPTLGVWNHFDDINFAELPQQFVLKCTHDSGSVVLCENKHNFDKKAAKDKLETSLRQNYYYGGREWPYKNVVPRIIAEEYIEALGGKSELLDYKFMCFNGKHKCTFTCTERFSGDGLKVTFFDQQWNMMEFERHYPKSKKNIAQPSQYNRMVELAETLSQNIPFARIDFYEVNDKIYFGEITLFPGSGFEEFTPKEWDFTLGSWIELPKKNKFT